jgi:hypothetical protein
LGAFGQCKWSQKSHLGHKKRFFQALGKNSEDPDTKLIETGLSKPIFCFAKGKKLLKNGFISFKLRFEVFLIENFKFEAL